MSEIVSIVNELVGDVNYIPYNINDTVLTIGLPPVRVKGLEYVFARRLNQKVKLEMSLTGNGKFIENQNRSGIIEFSIMSNTVSAGALQLLELTGLELPIISYDKSCRGTSFIAATRCRLIQTPEWRRARFPNLSIFTFQTPDLTLSNGVRFAE